jgi:hypothetical protein
MTVATPVKTSTAIAIGLAKLYLDDSATHIAEFSKILGTSAYVGAKTEVSFVGSKEVLEMEGSRRGFKEIIKRLISKAQVSLSCSILELTTKNMSYSFGGDGGVGNILNDLFGDPSVLRAELVFLYPDKVTQMIIILPSVQVISNPSLEFSGEDAITSSITLSPLATDGAVWTSDPLGRVYWTP